VRYNVREVQARNAASTGGDPALLEVGALRTRLLFANDVTPAYACLPLAHVVECRADKQVVLDDSFIPSVLHVRTAGRLAVLLLLNTTVAILIGLTVANLLKPGTWSEFKKPEAAAAKKLWICTSGPDEAAKARVRPILDAMGQGVYDFGPSVGASNVIKLAGNFMITALVEIMAEGSALAEKNRIPRAAFLDFFGETLFNSPVFNNYAKRLIAADFDKVGFTGQLALKDMRLGLETAAASATPMPVLSLLRDRFLAAIATGEGQLDASAIALRAAEDAGLRWFPRDAK